MMAGTFYRIVAVHIGRFWRLTLTSLKYIIVFKSKTVWQRVVVIGTKSRSSLRAANLPCETHGVAMGTINEHVGNPHENGSAADSHFAIGCQSSNYRHFAIRIRLSAAIVSR